LFHVRFFCLVNAVRGRGAVGVQEPLISLSLSYCSLDASRVPWMYIRFVLLSHAEFFRCYL
ncbi:MAG: hypothetical protein P8J18_02795, partial [Halieaceae bacterium]|nr:hypothetical protein [Halieaceae bacterium]